MTLEDFQDRTDVAAYWVAGFYNLDQQFAVGETSTWAFYNHSPMGHPAGQAFEVPPGALVFWNNLLGRDRHKAHERTATVTGIRHQTLGELTRISTDLFGMYEFFRGDECVAECEAEEDPGANDAGIDEWVLFVSLENVSPPQPLPGGGGETSTGSTRWRAE